MQCMVLQKILVALSLELFHSALYFTKQISLSCLLVVRFLINVIVNKLCSSLIDTHPCRKDLITGAKRLI